MNLKKNVKNVNGVYATLNNLGGKTMEWNVYYHNINVQEMHTCNIFDHLDFCKYVKKAAKEHKNKNEFAEQLRKELFYYFGSKAEWEIIITPWLGGNKEKESVKIDVYDQVMLNWDIFVNYVWENRKELLKEK